MAGNESVEFVCQADGDPPPHISWIRRDGEMPRGRSVLSNWNSNHDTSSVYWLLCTDKILWLKVNYIRDKLSDRSEVSFFFYS